MQFGAISAAMSLDKAARVKQSSGVETPPEVSWLVQGNDKFELWEAAKKLSLGPRLCGSQVDELLARAMDPTDDLVAETAIYALGFSKVSKRRLRDVILRLLDVADDVARPPGVRGHAAEGVGNLLSRTKLATLRRHAILRLTKHLTDPATEVRFWTAFSLGVLRARQSRSALVGVVGDEAVLPGWWSVGEEAADALDSIAGRESPDRPIVRPQ